MDYTETKSAIISKGRKLLLDKFIEGDYDKVKSITRYLKNEIEDKDYVSFYPAEYWLLSYFVGDYDKVIHGVNQLDSTFIYSFSKKIKPSYDRLYEKVRSKASETISQLEINITNSNLEVVEKDFLLMHLKSLLADEESKLISQDSLNNLADDFLIKYPQNDFETFTRENIRYKIVPSKWGFGLEFFSGYGVLTNDLSSNFKNTVPFGIAFDTEYEKLACSFRIYIGISKTKNDLGYGNNHIWESGSQANMIMPELSFGYVILDNKRLKLYPFVGFGGTSIEPTSVDEDEDPNLKNAGLEMRSTYMAGINLDFKMGSEPSNLVSMGPEQSYWFLRFRYSLNAPQFSHKYDGFDGYMHSFTIGIGGFGRRLKRDL